jgi:hypothetical protein
MDTNKRVKQLLAEWVKILHLEEWKIQVRLYKRLAPDFQHNKWRYSEKVSRIGLSINQTPAELEHSLVHELLHLIHSPENRVFDNLVESKITKREREAWDSEINLAQNVAIEQEVRLLYDLLGKEYPPHKELPA